METVYGILIPFLGTSLGAACVFFMKRGLSDLVQRSLTGFTSGVIHLEPADPGIGTVSFHGNLAVYSGSSWVLDRHFVFAFSGPGDSTPSSEQ